MPHSAYSRFLSKLKFKLSKAGPLFSKSKVCFANLLGKNIYGLIKLASLNFQA
jgi:hypothetical protein